MNDVRNMFLTTSLHAYRNVLNDDWIARLDALAAPKTKLSEMIFDLMMDWRAAAYTVTLPVLILDHTKAYHDGFINTGGVNTALLRLAKAIPAKLAQSVPALSNDPELVGELQGQIIELGARFEEARDEANDEYPLDDTWTEYLQQTAFQLSLWGSQRICFVAIYNAYEIFIDRVLCIAQPGKHIRTSDKKFGPSFADSFGESLLEKCWTADEVNVARLARHSLSHSGGRVTEKLAAENHGFVVRDDRIQVTPEKTKELFSLLQGCVYSLAEKAVTMAEFN